MTKTTKTGNIERDDPHWIEWMTGIISGLLVLAMLGWIAREAWLETDDPPELSVKVLRTQRTAGGYRVEFDIENAAMTTAAAVTVRGEIVDGADAVETADVTFDYVPAQSKSHGAVIFATDPAGRELRVRATGYTDP